MPKIEISGVSFIRQSFTIKINGFVQNVFDALFHTAASRMRYYHYGMLYCDDEHFVQSSQQFNLC